MTDLLTTRQVQDMLQVDRITVYRMLQDGRLKGVKIGQQWRFPQDEVDRLTGARQPLAQAAAPLAGMACSPDPNFPAHCVQAIQDLFAEVGQVSAIMIDMQGQPLTQPSRPVQFCQLLQATPTGLALAQTAWHDFAAASLLGNKFFTCPFGLQYIGAPVLDREGQIGLFLAGPFYWQPPNPREKVERIQRLAPAYGVSVAELTQAAAAIPVIEASQHERVEGWPAAAARAIMSILHERINFMDRLQQIASLTQIS